MNILENKYINIISYILNTLLIIIISLLIINKKDNKDIKVDTSSVSVSLSEKEEIIEEKTINVDIKGNVINPGVYKLKDGSIVQDIIDASGGVKDGVSLRYINLSRKLKDQMVIYIYTDKEINKLKKDLNTTKIVEKEVCECPVETIVSCEGASIIEYKEDNKVDDSNITKDKEIIEEKKEEITSSNNDENPSNTLISLNTASKEQLMSLPGIGESKALSIIKYREEKGFFNTIEDIKNVSGIGDSLFDKIKDYITV